MKHDVRLRQRATVYRVSAQDMVQCVVNRLLSCPLVCGFCAWGAALGNVRKVSTSPSPKGRYPASRRTRHSCRPPGAPVQRESRTVRPISLAFLGVQQTVGCQSTRATPWIAPRRHLWAIDVCTRSGRASRCGPTLPQARLHALLNASAASESTAAGSLKAASSNASAASESTTAGGLEAFSQSSAGAERFENASSKFRWNPSPLLPLM